MKKKHFFDETTEQSIVKTTIVSKYFWAWAKVIIPRAKMYDKKIAYIDLFAGPGRYKDGTKSTPLLILTQAIEDKDMREMLVTIFNDKDNNNSQVLTKAINALPGIEKLKYKPDVNNEEVGEGIVKMFEKMKFIPTLFFIDPWGYKGLSLRLINSVLKDWGCDCIIFFNYNRINMGLNNKAFKKHMNALFGVERAEQLRTKLVKLTSEQREFTIIEAIAEALQELGGKYVLPFCFKNAQGTRTSHHLIFVTKNFVAYDIMKGIMAKESSSASQGVPSFEYCPADERQPLLFELTRPLNELKKILMKDYVGKRITMKEIYQEHSPGKPYISKNYKEVLIELESSGKIAVNPPAKKRRLFKDKLTFGDNVEIIFPEKEL